MAPPLLATNMTTCTVPVGAHIDFILLASSGTFSGATSVSRSLLSCEATTKEPEQWITVSHFDLPRQVTRW